jgi:hypothetical protein
MLTDYDGPANVSEIFRHLVGEVITAAFINRDGNLILAGKSGRGIGIKISAYWPSSEHEVREQIEFKVKQIERLQSEIAGIPNRATPKSVSDTLWDRIARDEPGEAK